MLVEAQARISVRSAYGRLSKSCGKCHLRADCSAWLTDLIASSVGGRLRASLTRYPSDSPKCCSICLRRQKLNFCCGSRSPTLQLWMVDWHRRLGTGFTAAARVRALCPCEAIRKSSATARWPTLFVRFRRFWREGRFFPDIVIPCVVIRCCATARCW